MNWKCKNVLTLQCTPVVHLTCINMHFSRSLVEDLMIYYKMLMLLDLVGKALLFEGELILP